MFQKLKLTFRVLLLVAAGITAQLGSKRLHFEGAGAIGCLTVAFVATLHWRREEDKKIKSDVDSGLVVKRVNRTLFIPGFGYCSMLSACLSDQGRRRLRSDLGFVPTLPLRLDRLKGGHQCHSRRQNP